MDPFYFILEEFILPLPYNRPIAIIFGSMLLRLSLCSICTAEFGRFVGVCFCSVGIWLLGSLSNLNKIFKTRFKVGYRVYTELRIGFAYSSNFVNMLGGLLVFVGHVSLVLIAWLLLACYSDLATELFVFALIIAVGGLFLGLLALTILAQIPYLSETFLIFKKIANHGRNWKYKSLKAQKMLFVSCLHFFPLSVNIVPIFVNKLVENIVNAVVLF